MRDLNTIPEKKKKQRRETEKIPGKRDLGHLIRCIREKRIKESHHQRSKQRPRKDKSSKGHRKVRRLKSEQYTQLSLLISRHFTTWSINKPQSYNFSKNLIFFPFILLCTCQCIEEQYLAILSTMKSRVSKRIRYRKVALSLRGRNIFTI